jgi:methylmalonyl-CoA mutase
METMYQRSKIQDESLYYETLKHSGAYPIVGVNAFLSPKGSPTEIPREVIRATEEEMKYQIEMVKQLNKGNEAEAARKIKNVQRASVRNENVFEQLMEACKVCSVGQITDALFEVGGQYRRNM